MEVDIDCASKYEGGIICSGIGKSISVSGSMVSSDDGISGTLSGLTSMYKEKTQKLGNWPQDVTLCPRLCFVYE